MAIINPPCGRVCVCLYTCATCLSVRTLASVTVGYTSTSQGHCREPGGRKGGGVGGTGPADNDVSPARNATLKGAAQDEDPTSEDGFELVIISFCSG